MANNYTEIMKLVNAGNKMGLSNTITRDNGIPLDLSSVYNTFEDAVVYAATKSIAYQNQVLAAEGIVYVIVAESQGKVKVGEVEYENYLKPVGTAPSGDNASISVTAEGLVSIFGFASAQDDMVPVRENNVLVWKTLEEIGAGDGNDNTTYTFEANATSTGIIVTPLFNGQPVMDGETQVKYEVALDVYTKAEADEKFLAKADYKAYDDTALANKISTLETTVNGNEDVDGLVDKVAANATAISDEASARATAIENITKAETGAIAVAVKAEADVRDAAIKVVDDKIGEVAEGSTVVEMISAVEDKIPTNVSALNNDAGYLTEHQDISGKADKADTYTKNEVDTAIDNAKKSILGEGVAEAYDTLKEIQNILEGTDGETIDGLIETIDANKQAIATLNGDANTTGSVDKKIADAVAPLATAEALEGVKATAEAAQTAQEVSDAIDAKINAANLDKYAVKSEVDAALAGKANTADVVAKTDFETFQGTNAQAIADARTGAVSDVAAKGYAVATEVASTYATKDELTQHATNAENTYAKSANVEAELAKKIETASISHTSDDKAEGATVEGTALNIVVDAYTKAEADAQAEAIGKQIKDAGDGAAAALAGHVKTYEEKVGQIDAKDAAQDTAIEAAKAQADKGVEDAKTANDAIVALTSGAVKTNTDDITAVKGRLNTLEVAKGDHETRLSTAEGKITALDTAVKANSAAIGELQGVDTNLANEDARLAGLITTLEGTKANAADVYTKTQADDAIAAAIAGADLSKYAKAADLEAIYKVDAEGKASGVLADEITRAKAAEEANANAIATLIGTVEGDSTKSVRAIAAEETAKIVAGADTDYDTLKEIADFIKTDVTGAAGLANKVAAVDTKVDTGNKTVSTYVADAVAEVVQPKESAEISVAEDGTLGVKEININKLIQLLGDVLVLDGGSATVQAPTPAEEN